MTRHRPRIGRDHVRQTAETLRRAWLASQCDHARDIVELLTDRWADRYAAILGDAFDADAFDDVARPYPVERDPPRCH